MVFEKERIWTERADFKHSENKWPPFPWKNLNWLLWRMHDHDVALKRTRTGWNACDNNFILLILMLDFIS